MGREKLSPESKGSPPIEITPVIQRHDYDCGHACLQMLGYDAYAMFRKKGRVKGINTDDLRSIPGTLELSNHEDDIAAYDYSYPLLLIFTGKGPIQGMTHWVIRYKNSIYCPGMGKMSVATYSKRFIDIVMQYFAIPLHNGPPIPKTLEGRKKNFDEPSVTETMGEWYELMQSLDAAEKIEGASPKRPLQAAPHESLRDIVLRGLRLPLMKKEKVAYIQHERATIMLYLEEGKAIAELYSDEWSTATPPILKEVTNDLPEDIIASLKLRS